MISYRDLLPGILFTVALILFTVRLETPPDYVFDEVYHGYTAGQYVEGNRDAFVWDTESPDPDVAYMWNHPPLGVLLIAGGIVLWGDVPFGWRFSSALFGAFGVALAFLFVRALTGRTAVGLVTAVFLLLDNLYFTQSRIAMLDIFGYVFVLCAFWAAHRYLTSPPEAGRRPLVLIGLFCGLAIATKWNAAYAATLLGILVLVRVGLFARSVARSGGAPLADPSVRSHLIWVGLALGLVPAAAYLASYIPFFLAGHGIADFVELQNQILRYHAGLAATHPDQSSWWQWPLTQIPVWYHAAFGAEASAHIYAIGNPFLHWVFVPAVTWVSWYWWRRNRQSLALLWIGFFGQWMAWALVPRIAFIYHFLPAALFGCLATAVLVVHGIDRGGGWRYLALGYVTVVGLAFAFFYPISASVPLSAEAFESRIWFESWR